MKRIGLALAVIVILAVLALRFRPSAAPGPQRVARTAAETRAGAGASDVTPAVPVAIAAVPEVPPVISQERRDAARGIEIAALIADDTAAGREKLRNEFKAWAKESPRAARDFLASHPDFSLPVRTLLAEALNAGWALIEPDVAWQFATRREPEGIPFVGVSSVINSLGEAGQFDTARRLLDDGNGLALSVGVQALATNWIGVDPDAARAWIGTLSGASLANANLGVRIAEIRADPQKVITQLASADARDASNTAIALLALPATSGFDPVNVLMAAPNAADGRYDDTIMASVVSLN